MSVMPGARADRLETGGRQFVCQVELGSLAERGQLELIPPQPDGLVASAFMVDPGMPLPDASAIPHGRQLVILSGGLSDGGRRYDAVSVLVLLPDESTADLRGVAEERTAILSLDFPDPARAPRQRSADGSVTPA
jgi:hypothetical protein